MKTVRLSELFAMPLQSAVRAQALAIQEGLSFIEQFGLQDGQTRMFRFRTERTVEERDASADATAQRSRPLEVSIPLLALIQPPNVRLHEMNVEMALEVVEPVEQPMLASTVPAPIRGVSFASSKVLATSLASSSSTTMRVNMKITSEVSEGLARMGDLLTDLLSGKESSQERESPKVTRVPGIGAAIARRLLIEKIETVSDLLRSTATPSSIQELAKSLSVSEARVRAWRDAAAKI